MSWRGTLQRHERKHQALPVDEHAVLNGLFPETPRDVAEKLAFAKQMGIDARYHELTLANMTGEWHASSGDSSAPGPLE